MYSCLILAVSIDNPVTSIRVGMPLEGECPTIPSLKFVS